MRGRLPAGARASEAWRPCACALPLRSRVPGAFRGAGLKGLKSFEGWSPSWVLNLEDP